MTYLTTSKMPAPVADLDGAWRPGLAAPAPRARGACGGRRSACRPATRTEWDHTDTYRTIADGLRTTSLGVYPFEYLRRYVDDIVTVTEAQMRAAMREVAVGARLVVEPAGAVAAWMHNIAPRPSHGRIAAIVSGGSVDPGLLHEVFASAAGDGT